MSHPMIDLRSDTVTRPTAAMREAMARAEVGDDMFGEDPTVNALERRLAELLGKEAALFACSGTQSNQLALWAHCRAGDEVLLHRDGHINNYEGGAPAVLHGVTCRGLEGNGGLIDLPALEAALRPDDQHYCRTRLVAVENTTNKGGGRVWPLEQLDRVGRWAHDRRFGTHMDGARLFNACVAAGYSPTEATRAMDTVSICFSKGLGCPLGSVLVGSGELIAQARRGRKIFGGALRQAGIVAAAALYALDHHVERLADDHRHARQFAEGVASLSGLRLDLATVESNLVFFEVDESLGTAEQLARALHSEGVRVFAVGAQRIRVCTHLDVGAEAVERAIEGVRKCLERGFATALGSSETPYAYR